MRACCRLPHVSIATWNTSPFSHRRRSLPTFQGLLNYLLLAGCYGGRMLYEKARPVAQWWKYLLLAILGAKAITGRGTCLPCMLHMGSLVAPAGTWSQRSPPWWWARADDRATSIRCRGQLPAGQGIPVHLHHLRHPLGLLHRPCRHPIVQVSPGGCRGAYARGNGGLIATFCFLLCVCLGERKGPGVAAAVQTGRWIQSRQIHSIPPSGPFSRPDIRRGTTLGP